MEGRKYLWMAAGMVTLFAGLALFRGGHWGFKGSPSGSEHSPGLPTNAVTIVTASSNTKQEWWQQSVTTFNVAARDQARWQVNGKPIFVEVLKETIDGKSVDYRSGTMIADTLQGKIKPTVLSPGEESWIDKFRKEWREQNGTDPIRGQVPVLVRTPLVVAMWRSRAKALGCFPDAAPACTWQRIRDLAGNGWAKYGYPQWGRFKFGYGYFGESNSGTLGVVSLCLAGAGKTTGLTLADIGDATGCGAYIRTVERSKVHSGKSDLWLLDRMVKGGPEYLDAVVTFESNVVAVNRNSRELLREPLVAFHPRDITFVVGHPFAILAGVPWVTPEQVAAAEKFRDFLLTPEQQAAVLSVGLRPVDPSIPIGPPIDPANGVPGGVTLHSASLPESLLVDRIGELWHQLKKHSIIAIVFDKSGSMAANGKIWSAVRGAQEFVRRMDGQDHLLWIPFDNQVYTGVSGHKAKVGEALTEEIAATTADGGTALYDAIFTAYGRLEGMRQAQKDTVRYGIVLLSDGKDENSSRSLVELEAQIRPHEMDPLAISIHTIAIGDDANEPVLRKIAAIAHGKFYQGQSETDIRQIYQDIAAHY